MKAFITVIASVFVFGLVIFIHEFGHFITAKRSGVKVNEFSIGMGPLLFSRTKGETQYSVRLLPIGGFCQMEGEDEDSDDEGSFTNASVWKRIAITVAGAVMNLVLGFLILGILTATGGSIASRTVGKFYEDSATEASGLKIGDKIVNPYFSTDSAAALRAVEIGAEAVLKATMVDGVYNKDPHKYEDAVRYSTVTFTKVLADNLNVIDSTAASMCRDNNIPVLVFDLQSDPQNLVRVVKGEDIGTLIKED